MKHLILLSTLMLFCFNNASAQTAEEINDEAMNLIAQGKINEAIEQLQKAISTDSTYAKSYVNLGFIFYTSGMQEQAISLYAKALQVDPDSPIAHNNLGAALLAAGDYRQAIGQYNAALKLDENYPEAHNNLSYALHAVGAYELAMQEAQKAIELKPDYARAYNNLGIVLNSTGKYAEAETNFKKALELDPNLGVALNNLGTNYRLQGNFDKSVELHKQALAVDTLNVETYNSLGLTYMNQGKLDKSIKALQKALKMLPNYAIAHNNLSYAFYEVYNYAMAMQHASAAERYGLKVTPDYMENLKKALNPEYLRARHILVKTQTDADAIIAAFSKGENFTKLALEKSLDKNTAPKGGDLGYFKKGDMVQSFEKAIQNTKIGKISTIVKTDLGYHIFQRMK